MCCKTLEMYVEIGEIGETGEYGEREYLGLVGRSRARLGNYSGVTCSGGVLCFITGSSHVSGCVLCSVTWGGLVTSPSKFWTCVFRTKFSRVINLLSVEKKNRSRAVVLDDFVNSSLSRLCLEPAPGPDPWGYPGLNLDFHITWRTDEGQRGWTPSHEMLQGADGAEQQGRTRLMSDVTDARAFNV